MACTVDISYKLVGSIGSIYDLDNYSKTGQFKIKAEIFVGCKGSCPDPEVACPEAIWRRTKEVTLDLENVMPPATGPGSDDRKTLDRAWDDHEKYKNMGTAEETFKLRMDVKEHFKEECRKFGGGVQVGYEDIGQEDYGTKSLARLVSEGFNEKIDKLKTKAKFTNLCDCDVTTTTVLASKVLDHIVDEVEKDLFVSRNP